MMWMVALLLRVVHVNSVMACLCHRVLYCRLREDDVEGATAPNCFERPCCQTLLSSMPQQVLPP